VGSAKRNAAKEPCAGRRLWTSPGHVAALHLQGG
jgi:hypothetical protein